MINNPFLSARRQLEMRFLVDLKREILGRAATIGRPENSWFVHFGPDFKIRVESQWRLIDNKRILVADGDDGQWFGLSAPVDAAANANEHLRDRRVVSVDLNLKTGGLRVHFSNSVVLEIITNSSGYESWVMWLRDQHFAVGASGGLV